MINNHLMTAERWKLGREPRACWVRTQGMVRSDCPRKLNSCSELHQKSFAGAATEDMRLLGGFRPLELECLRQRDGWRNVNSISGHFSCNPTLRTWPARQYSLFTSDECSDQLRIKHSVAASSGQFQVVRTQVFDSLKWNESTACLSADIDFRRVLLLSSFAREVPGVESASCDCTRKC